MPRLKAETHRDSTPADWSLSRLLGQWLLLGILLAALFPAARGYSESIGWLPLWLLGAPLVSLLVLHRQQVWALMAPGRPATRMHAGAMRRRATAGQARRVAARRGASPVRRPLRASPAQSR